VSIWGKIIGGAIGFGIGGPIGALIGAAAGHFAVDKRASGAERPRIEFQSPWSREARQVAFMVAVIALSAKLAKSDGQVTRNEVAALKRIFHVPPSAAKEVGAIFDQAKQDAVGFEPYAQQIVVILGGNKQMLEELLAALLMIAHADGHYHQAERQYIAAVARIFGFGPADLHRIESTFVAGAAAPASDPYEILGVARQASDQEIKSAYRKLLQENHPDKLMAQGLPEDFIEVANKKMAEINAAYDRIKKERGIS
jgi:DnaJ like chaperone protein